MHFRLSAFAIAAGVFAADRLAKFIVESRVEPWQTIMVIPGFFNIIHTRNPGAAFSLLATADPAWRSVLLSGLSFAAVAALTVLLWRAPRPGSLPRLPLALILGGAAGNLFDRLWFGEVTDFLDFHLGRYHWPAFNLADSAISVGAALLMLDLWRSREPRRETT
jgi:signal peptidase II